VINRKGEIDKEYVRLSLKEALVNLPSSHFAQVHRSYAVNLQHVKHIKKRFFADKQLRWSFNIAMGGILL